MRMGLPERLLACSYASDASSLLLTIPTIGGFNAQNLISMLNDSPTLEMQWRNHASCGPGSRSFLQRIFGKDVINSKAMEEAGLRWMYANQWRYWGRLGLDPPHAWKLGLRPGMRVLDIENSLCWCHRYVNDITRLRLGNLTQRPWPNYDPSVSEEMSGVAWCDEEKWAKGLNELVWDGGDDEEKKARVDSLGEEVYEVEKIVARQRGAGAKGNGVFRVRWKGYMPEEDTWEPESELQKGAREVGRRDELSIDSGLGFGRLAGMGEESR
jgi:hypothetical protein